jgi:hypothetical protein
MNENDLVILRICYSGALKLFVDSVCPRLSAPTWSCHEVVLCVCCCFQRAMIAITALLNEKRNFFFRILDTTWPSGVSDRCRRFVDTRTMHLNAEADAGVFNFSVFTFLHLLVRWTSRPLFSRPLACLVVSSVRVSVTGSVCLYMCTWALRVSLARSWCIWTCAFRLTSRVSVAGSELICMCSHWVSLAGSGCICTYALRLAWLLVVIPVSLIVDPMAPCMSPVSLLRRKVVHCLVLRLEASPLLVSRYCVLRHYTLYERRELSRGDNPV